LGPVLVGKTQTLFGGLIGQPELLHDGAPMALGALRIEQIRYSHNFGGGLVLSVALESGPGTSDAGGQVGTTVFCSSINGTCDTTPANPGGTGNALTGNLIGPTRWPDVVAALLWNFPNGALYASGMVGQRFYDPGQNFGDPTDVLVWGGAIGFRYDFGRVEIGGIGGVGEGLGNKYFNGGATGFSDTLLVLTFPGGGVVQSGDLRAPLVWGAVGYVQVKLTDTIRATGAFNYTINYVLSEVPGGQRNALTGLADYYWAAFGNILWNPVPQVTFGAEYSYQLSSRYNGPNANGHRLQFAGIYRF
jgi:hypothetical protein